MMENRVTYQSEKPGDRAVATITMDDGKANSLSLDMLAELHEAFDRAEAEEAVVILAGREGRFCGGFDLATFKQGQEAIMQMATSGARLAERMMGFPYPVIVACNGHGLAMGAVLLLSADYRIGAEGNFKIGLNEVHLGMGMPGWANIICKNSLTPAWLKRAVMQGEILLPGQAMEAGFLDETVAAGELPGRARAKAKELGGLPAAAFKSIKLGLRKDMLAELNQSIK